MFRTLLRDRRGAVLAITAAALPVVVGVTGLGVEVGLWHADKRAVQTAADAAALSGAFERVRGNPAGLRAAARREAERNGFLNAAPNTIVINNPPQTGAFAGQTTAVEVRLTRPHGVLFVQDLLGTKVTIGARSVAAVRVTGQACVLALDATANAAINNQGSTIVNMPGCVLAANSVSASAISISGSAAVTALSLWTVGQYQKSGSGALQLERPPTTNAWELEDPWRNLEPPQFSGCLANNAKYNSGSHTLSPGVYCGGISFGSQSQVTLQPGTYIINAGDLTVNGGARVRCNCTGPDAGVTFILTSSGAASAIGTVSINGGADIVLRAPSGAAEPYRGVLILQDRRASQSATNKLNGGASMNLDGGIYFPRQPVQFAGNSSATTCTQIVARTVTFTGNSTINNTGCIAAGVDPVTVTAARLVE